MYKLHSCHKSFNRLIRCYSAKPKPFTFDEAERWIARFTKNDIPKENISVTFSRSSGPGGQNVNKVNTKVDLRLHLDQAQWIPHYAREKLKDSSRLNKAGELVVTSNKSRTQSKNLQDCYDKLISTIKQALVVPREADKETLDRIKALKVHEDGKRKELKKRHSNKKATRRIKNNDY